MTDLPEFRRRAVLLGGVQALAGAVLAGRMAWLSLADHERYALASEENRVDLRLIPPRRGWLVDMRGEPLALNRPAYGVELVPALAGDLERALALVAEHVPLADDDLERIRADVAARPKSLPVSVAADIGWEAYAALNLKLGDVPGLNPVRSYVRQYPGGEAFGHTLGYVGAPTRAQFEKSRDALLIFPGFRVGKDGVERALDARLRGQAGARRVEVNARGRVIRELDTRPDVPAAPVRLTLDGALQRFAADRIGDGSASVVVIDVLTGDLRCLLSMPAFDPNVFSNRIPSKLWKAMQADDRKPLLNKSTGGGYTPGSTFKMVTALAALEAGVPATDTVGCGGAYRMGSNTWHCHKRGGHGTVDMVHGLAYSCNVFFYATGRRIGVDAIARAARRLGLGQRFPLPVSAQVKGLVPDEAWKTERFGKPWSVAETLNTAIGQGYLVANPLQLAVMAARIASGRAVMPHLLDDGAPRAFAGLGIAPEHLAVVREGMTQVVNGPGGTARSARLNIDGVLLAGKTGTAQVRRITSAERRRGVTRNESLPWRMRDHGLFVAFAPAHAPRYAIAVVAEHGGSGSKAAAPIAKDVMTWLFDRPRAEKALAATLAERERRRLAAEAEAARLAAAAEVAATSNGIARGSPPAPPAG